MSIPVVVVLSPVTRKLWDNPCMDACVAYTHGFPVILSCSTVIADSPEVVATMKKIVIVGGGYAGVEAGLTLHRRLKRREQVEITLVNRNPFHTLLTELHEVAGTRVGERSVMVSLRHIFQYTKVKVVQDSITEFDFDNKAVRSENREYQYDYLILALGSEPTFYGIEGMEDHAFTLWSLEDAQRIRSHITEMVAKAARSTDPFERQAYLTFVVGGGGFTGVEMVGELIRWKRQLAKEYNIPVSEIRLILVEAMDRILPTLDEALAQRVENYLDHNHVQVLNGQPIKRVTPDGILLGQNLDIPTKTLIWAGGVVANRTIQDSGLKQSRRGRLAVNNYLQVDGHPDVLAAGDNCGLTWEEDGRPVEMPALVESALATGKTAALNVIAALRGTEMKRSRPKYHGLMVSVGRWWGVANIMEVSLVGILAIVMKHMVNLHYLFGIGGFELIIRYIRHEFLDMKAPFQNIAEVQFTRQRPLFFLVPLRLYLGYMWLEEGVKKVMEGWWNSVALGKAALSDPSLTGASQAIPVDGVAGATLMELVGEHTPGWYAWIVENLIYPNALLFQRLVVLTEIGLGLAFLLGFMTVIAAAVSIGMNINFLLSTGLYDFWYIFASIPMFAGAGDVFGLDYFLMPYLMRQWRYLVRNKRIKPILLR